MSISAAQQANQKSISPDALELAASVRHNYASTLLAHPEVRAVGIGQSLDAPTEAALICFVKKGSLRSTLPQELEGIRIRIIELMDKYSPEAVLSDQDTAVLAEEVTPEQRAQALSDNEIARVRAVHSKTVDGLMHSAGIQAVGITSSADNPGEAALVVYVVRGAMHDRIPPVMNGVRTVVRESSPFQAGFGGASALNSCGSSRRPIKLPR